MADPVVVESWHVPRALSDKALRLLTALPMDEIERRLRAPMAADEEVAELTAEVRYLVRELRDQADDLSPSLELFGLIHRAADLLERQALRPIPVSERLPGPEDCDAESCCWRWNTIGRLWTRQQYARKWYEFHSHWLPAHALPLPEVE